LGPVFIGNGTFLRPSGCSAASSAFKILGRERRASISALTEGSKHTENQLDTLIRYEQGIEAIDRAITDEQLAAAGMPPIKYED
jgi:hypothetical protein